MAAPILPSTPTRLRVEVGEDLSTQEALERSLNLAICQAEAQACYQWMTQQLQRGMAPNILLEVMASHSVGRAAID